MLEIRNLHAAIDGKVTRSGDRWQIDIGSVEPIYGIKLTSAKDKEPLDNIRISVFSEDPGKGGPVLWQRDYLTGDAGLQPGRTLVLKARERSAQRFGRRARGGRFEFLVG